MFNKKEFTLVVKLLFVIVLWMVFTGFILPALLHIASTVLMILVMIGTALGAYFTIKFLSKLYRDNKVVTQ